MWLHIPESCLSAPDTAGLISPSDSFFQALERSATLSGKFHACAFWRREWQKGHLTPLRFGTTSPHSTLPPGLAAWISSWQDSPANRTQLQANGTERQTTGGLSGTTSSASPKAVQLDLFSWKTSPDYSPVPEVLPSPKSVQTWNTQALRISPPASWVLAMSGHLTSGTASSSWHTPGACETPGGAKRKQNGKALSAEALHWPTPASRDWRDGRSNLLSTNARPLNEVATAFSPLDLMQTGQQLTPNSGPRQLNPLFVEWLMGLPEGWTSVEQTG